MNLPNLLWNVTGKYHSSGPAEPGEFTGPYTELESAACRVAEVAAEGWCFKTLRDRQCSQVGRPVFGKSFQIKLAGCLSFALTYFKMVQEKFFKKIAFLNPQRPFLEF